jgi:hypothetical protein
VGASSAQRRSSSNSVGARKKISASRRKNIPHVIQRSCGSAVAKRPAQLHSMTLVTRFHFCHMNTIENGGASSCELALFSSSSWERREKSYRVGSLKRSVSFGTIPDRPSSPFKKAKRLPRWVADSLVWIVPPPGSVCKKKDSGKVWASPLWK